MDTNQSKAHCNRRMEQAIFKTIVQMSYEMYRNEEEDAYVDKICNLIKQPVFARYKSSKSMPWNYRGKDHNGDNVWVVNSPTLVFTTDKPYKMIISMCKTRAMKQKKCHRVDINLYERSVELSCIVVRRSIYLGHWEVANPETDHSELYKIVKEIVKTLSFFIRQKKKGKKNLNEVR